ncbi:hypothetical protein K7640_00180 [Micromonospora sp. PLK6-60]|uniref:hypothetical protein n=1 Tax=Micromonospora sp. PLK6-60 TaxID=2873383 RepID=UPI001CA77D31|nr:hypothetical protein [Micromonospora sp. PLK6-60]MBY8870260.1 hypothetical protein [Micromonospora sp. PLK6-60]
MAVETAGSRQRDIDLHRGSERLLFRLLLLVAVPGVTWALAQPGLTSWWEDAGFAGFAAVLCWVMFRAGFRTGVVARAGHFSVTNFVSTHEVPYRDIEDITVDWLSLRFTLRSGGRVRAWGLPESFLTSRGDRALDLVRRLGAIVEQRAGVGADAARRRFLADWWVLVALLALFAAAIGFGRG